MIVHKANVGDIINVGGKNELPNIAVAKKLIDILGLKDKEEALITFVEDRHFNDLRYTIDTTKLKALGWVEEKEWEQGLKDTVEWYKKYSSRYGDFESALVAHPRAGLNAGAS
jgi:dTDP-D-glucose 4,6-dehydratase